MHGYLFKHVTHSLEKLDLKFYENLLPLPTWECKKYTDTQWNEWQVISKINEFHAEGGNYEQSISDHHDLIAIE